jgi:hypothetical protein
MTNGIHRQAAPLHTHVCPRNDINQLLTLVLRLFAEWLTVTVMAVTKNAPAAPPYQNAAPQKLIARAFGIVSVEQTMAAHEFGAQPGFSHKAQIIRWLSRRVRIDTQFTI